MYHPPYSRLAAILLCLILSFYTSSGKRTSSSSSSSSQFQRLEFRGGSQSSNTESSTYDLATNLRLQGKELHDNGDFEQAAKLFKEAADTLQAHEENQQQQQQEQVGEEEIYMPLSEDYATCRLHQALCHLKSENYELCLDACTSILQDETDANGSTPGGSRNIAINTPAVRARAFHRRAKAKLGLGDSTGALQDARSAAFLGDRKAVALYGRLMRDPSSSSSSMEQNTFQSSILSQQPNSSHSALLESLLDKSKSPNIESPFSPASLLMGGTSKGGSKGVLGALSGSSNSLTKSVITSLSKRLDDEQTQTMICNYLQKTNKSQLQQLAAMAGLSNSLEDSTFEKIEKVCHGVTPKTIKRIVTNSKRALYGIQILRRTAMIINKYKSLLIGLLIFQWAKSAWLRPIPMSKVAKKAAKTALKEAMKASRV